MVIIGRKSEWMYERNLIGHLTRIPICWYRWKRAARVHLRDDALWCAWIAGRRSRAVRKRTEEWRVFGRKCKVARVYALAILVDFFTQ